MISLLLAVQQKAKLTPKETVNGAVSKEDLLALQQQISRIGQAVQAIQELPEKQTRELKITTDNLVFATNKVVKLVSENEQSQAHTFLGKIRQHTFKVVFAVIAILLAVVGISSFNAGKMVATRLAEQRHDAILPEAQRFDQLIQRYGGHVISVDTPEITGWKIMTGSLQFNRFQHDANTIIIARVKE